MNDLSKEAARLIALDNYDKGVDDFADFLDLVHGSWKEKRFTAFVRKFHEFKIWQANAEAARAEESNG